MEALKVVFGCGRPHEQQVTWPIVKATEKAWQVATPGGPIWIPSWEWTRRVVADLGRLDDATRLKRITAFMTEISADMGDVEVRVAPPSRLAARPSACVKVTFDLEKLKSDRDRWVSTHRTFSAPASLLSEVESGRSLVPRWLLKKHLKEHERIPEGDGWAGLRAVIAQLEAAFDVATEPARRERADREARELAYKALQASVRDRYEQLRVARAALFVEDAEFALCFARRRLTLAELAHLGCRLNHWPTWVPGGVPGPGSADLEKLILAVRSHPEFPAWRLNNLEKRGTLLSARHRQS